MKYLPYLHEEEVRRLADVETFLTACHRAFSACGRGELHSPPRVEVIEKRDGLDYFRLEMPAEWPGRYRARKVIEEYSDVATGRLERRCARIRLEDLVGGRAIEMDADYITDMRTGAAGALGIEYIGRRPVDRVAILGTGRIARGLALAVDRRLRPEQIRVTSRKGENRERFVRDMAGRLQAELRPSVDIESCLDGCDAALIAVPTPRPILRPEMLGEDIYLVVVGGDSRTRQVEEEVLERMDVLVDRLDQARESGEFRYARERGREKKIHLARNSRGEVLDIGDAACGRLEGAPRLVYLTGLAAQDLCAAAAVYEGMLNAGRSTFAAPST